MEYIIRFSDIPTTKQVEEALKKSKPMALSKMSFMEYTSWGLQDLIHGIYIFYHYDQVIYLGTCRSRDFTSRIIAHLAVHKNAWMNTLPRYAEKKYKLSSTKEALEYILEEFSIQLIHIPTFPNRRELSEEEVVKLNNKVTKLLQLENGLRFLLQPELNSKMSGPPPSLKTKAESAESVHTNQKGRPTRNTVKPPDWIEKILIINISQNLSPAELKEAAAGPWRISNLKKGTKIAVWCRDKIIAVWRLRELRQEANQYRLKLGATLTTTHAAAITKQLGSSFRMYSKVKVHEYIPPKPTSASSISSGQTLHVTVDNGVLRLDVSEGERLLSDLRDEERAQIHTLDICAFPNKKLSPIGSFPNLKKILIQRCGQLSDLSILLKWPHLERLTLSQCPSIQDFSPIKALSSLSQVTLSDLEGFSDLSVLSATQTLLFLELHMLPKITDLTPIKALSKVTELRLEWCKAISDTSAICGLKELTSLLIGECLSLKEVTLFDLPTLRNVTLHESIEKISYKNLPSIIEFSANRFPKLQKISLEHMSSLQELRLHECPNLSNLQTDDTCNKFQSIHISACPLLTIEPFLSRQQKVLKMVLSDLESILEIPMLLHGEKLKELSLHCPNLNSTHGLSAYPNLSFLSLSGSPIQDLSPIAELKDLQKISLNNCRQIKDLSPLSGLTKLSNRLYLKGCIELKNISLSHSFIEGIVLDDCVESISLHHCPNIQRLMLNRLPNLSSVSLSHLDVLEQVDLRKTPRLLSLTDFASLPKLKTILLRECSALRDISGIQNLSELSELDIKGCPELQQETLYPTLYSIPQLHTLKSEIPSNILTKLMASLAFKRKDTDFIAENIDAWFFAAQQSPTTPGILSALAHASSLLSDSTSILVSLLELAAQNDVQEVTALFDVVAYFVEEPRISAACSSLLAQEKVLLPPQTLVEYHRLFPSNRSLKENAILAILRSMEQKNIADWTLRSQRKILSMLQDTVSEETLTHAINALKKREFVQTDTYLFGIICNTLSQVSNMNWRVQILPTLQMLAFQQVDYTILEKSTSFLIQGISKFEDLEWIKKRIDDVLSEAAKINPDTSELKAVCAVAQAKMGRWDQAIQVAFEITNTGVKDETFCTLIERVLQTLRQDRLKLAISMVAGISDYLRRRDQLMLLQEDDNIAEDLVAFGQVIQLLLEYPEQLRSFVRDTVQQKPTLSTKDWMSLCEQTDREKELISLRDQIWIEAIKQVTPENLKPIQQIADSPPLLP